MAILGGSQTTPLKEDLRKADLPDRFEAQAFDLWQLFFDADQHGRAGKRRT
jgi:hypothetical protein